MELWIVLFLIGIPATLLLASGYSLGARAQRRLEQDHEQELGSWQEKTNALEETTRKNGRFLARMSHELRTPMNSIIGFSELLSSGRLGQLKPDARQAATDIRLAAAHLHHLLNDIVDLAAIDTGRWSFEPVRVEVPVIIDEVLTGIHTEMDAKDLRSSIEVDAPVAFIVADPTRLRQILHNFVANAVRHSPPQGQIRIRARSDGAMMRIEVQDDGPGVRRSDHDRIFRSFEQVDSARAGGTGLGLAVVRELVEAQGGRVGVQSRLGKGATFWADVPCVWSRQSSGLKRSNVPAREVTPLPANAGG